MNQRFAAVPTRIQMRGGFNTKMIQSCRKIVNRKNNKQTQKQWIHQGRKKEQAAEWEQEKPMRVKKNRKRQSKNKQTNKHRKISFQNKRGIYRNVKNSVVNHNVQIRSINTSEAQWKLQILKRNRDREVQAWVKSGTLSCESFKTT